MYHVFKQTRLYCGYPYEGYSWMGPATFQTLEEAKTCVKTLNEVNPVGWNIWDGESQKLIEGFDFFSD